MSFSLRQKWCRQITEAIHYIHLKGVIHSDLRPENCLVHASLLSLDILLCDFGGSMCSGQGLDGKGLPDHPFWNGEWLSTPATDIFSLGSVFYTIMTGHWPYKLGLTSDRQEDRWAYEDRVEAEQKRRLYPDVTSVQGGKIIQGCWRQQYLTAEGILQAQEAEMRGVIAVRNFLIWSSLWRKWNQIWK